MIVTKIEAVTKTKYKIFLDEQFAFVLYKGELSRYHIREGHTLERDIYDKIRGEVIQKRAKLRAMHLLNAMGRTEEQLREKLRLGHYPEDIIDEAVSYVKSFGYIDDAAYARCFVESRKGKKSRKEIYVKLCQKGLKSEEIDAAFEACYDGEDARAAIEGILQKKHYDKETADRMQTQKILGYLTRKGFHYEDIRQVIQVSEQDA